MAFYIKKAEVVEASQWTKVGDLEIIETLSRSDAKALCPTCGMPLQDHGEHVLARGWQTVKICPGMWIVKREDGRVEYLDDATFKARYEGVKTSG